MCHNLGRPAHPDERAGAAKGAAGPKGGLYDSLALPCADTEAMSIFLGEVDRRHVLMFMGRAGWHTAKGPVVPPGMEIAFLPPALAQLTQRSWM